jgi:hypothetical protein
MGEAGFGRNDRRGRVAGHNQALQLVSKQNYLHPIDCQVNFETLL